MPLHIQILFGLLAGVVAGVAANAMLGPVHSHLIWFIENITRPIGQLFLRPLLMVVIPLVFSALVVGVAGVRDFRKLGRVGLKTFAYTLVISGVSVVMA